MLIQLFIELQSKYMNIDDNSIIIKHIYSRLKTNNELIILNNKNVQFKKVNSFVILRDQASKLIPFWTIQAQSFWHKQNLIWELELNLMKVFKDFVVDKNILERVYYTFPNF